MKRLLGALALVSVLVLLIVGASLPASAGPPLKPGPTPVPENPPEPGGGGALTPCPVTPLADGAPSDPNSVSLGGKWHGNGALWAAAYSWAAGSDGAKVMWYRSVPGKLTVSGRRLDAPSERLAAGALASHVPDGYGDQGLQVSGLYFPTGGCWEVTGEVGGQTLRFVVQIEPGDAPDSSLLVFDRALNGPQPAVTFEDVDKRHLYIALPDEHDPLAVSVSVLDRKTMAEVARKPWPAFCRQLLVVAANGDWICAYDDGQNGRLVRLLNVDFNETGAPHSLGYIAGRAMGAAMTRTGRLYVVTEGAEVAVIDVPRQRILYYKRLSMPSETATIPGQIMLSPDGRRLYVGFEEEPGAARVVRAYDAAIWRALGDFDFRSMPTSRFSLSDEGDRLYTVGVAGQASVYDTMTFKPVEAGS